MSVHSPGAPGVDERLFALGIPVLGICYGQQLMAQALGGEVARTGGGEFGRAELHADTSESILFSELSPNQTVWMSHNDAVAVPPEGFRTVASTEGSPIASFEDPTTRLFGVQFHPEVSHTSQGTDLLKNFLFKGCGLMPSWTMTSIIE